MPTTFSGPFFAPDADARVEEELDEGRHQLSGIAEARVRETLGDVLQHPTGYYESRIETQPLAGDRDLVTDQNVVYGPWLEGIGSRNKDTRFKGYHTFRLVSQSLQFRAVDVGQEAARRIVEVLS